jgi:hypothetical protein
LDELAKSKQKKRDTRESRLYIEKALIEHDYRTAIASLDEEAQYELAVSESLRDFNLTRDGRARGGGIVIRAASSSRVSNLGGANTKSSFGRASGTSSEAGNVGKTVGSGSGSSCGSLSKQSSLHSFYPGHNSPFDIDLVRSRAPSQPRVDIMLDGDSKLKLWKAWAKWFHANDLPGRKADCPYFRAAVKLTQQLGELPIPKGRDIDGPLLDMNYNDLEAHMGYNYVRFMDRPYNDVYYQFHDFLQWSHVLS